MKPQTLIWLLIAAMASADCVLLVAEEMTIALPWTPALGTLCLFALSTLYSQRLPSIAVLSAAAAQVVAFSYVAAVLTYVAMAISPFPLADAALARADMAIGIDWPAWFAFVMAHPKFHLVLALAYASIPVQGLGLLVYFSFADPNRVHEVLLATILSLIVIVPIMVLLPALAAWSWHCVAITSPWRDDILALRAHTLTVIRDMTGIGTFPSFHTVLAVLLATMARGHRLFPPVLVLNLLMIASVMTEGGHYGVDMVSGAAVAVLAFAVTQFLLAWCSSHWQTVDSRFSSTNAHAAGS